MHFSNILAGLALVSTALAVPAPPAPPCPSDTPSPPGHGGPPGPPKPVKEDSLYKAMEKRGRSFIGSALTIRNETRESEILAQDLNSYANPVLPN